jgi:hypothetical protein
MKKIIYSLTVLLLVINMGCKSKKYTMDQVPATQIAFGAGGGFAGIVKQYSLLENGEIITKMDKTTTYEKVGSVDEQIAKGLFLTVTGLVEKKYKLDSPGNIYQFIELKNAGKDTKFTWGDAAQADPKLNKVYQLLIKSLK